MSRFEDCANCGRLIQRVPKEENPANDPRLVWWHFPTRYYRCVRRNQEEPLTYATPIHRHKDPLLHAVLR